MAKRYGFHSNHARWEPKILITQGDEAPPIPKTGDSFYVVFSVNDRASGDFFEVEGDEAKVRLSCGSEWILKRIDGKIRGRALDPNRNADMAKNLV